MQSSYDVVVIGAGSGGLTTAVGFSKVGKSVLLIECNKLGGECTNYGCVPSKALLHHAKSYAEAVKIAGKHRDANQFRDEAFVYVRNKVKEFRDEEKPLAFAALGIDVELGEASFKSRNSISVNNRTVHFKKAVIASGSSPRTVEIKGVKETDLLTNQNLFALKKIPEKLLVIGSGPIGLEMGQALALLGSQVTIATIDHEIATKEDEVIRPILRQTLEEQGVKIETYAYIKAVENGSAIFDRQDGDIVIDTFSVPFDKILLAIGRTPNLPRGLDKAAISYTAKGLTINNQYQTTNKKVFAVGDVSQKLKFTHTADDAARQVVSRVASRGLLRTNAKKAVPKVTYTSPEIAQVGMLWSEAKTKYGENKLIRIEVPFSENDRARTDSAENGILIVIARRFSGRILGANLIGPRAGELITIFTLAIDHKLSFYKLRNLIYAYPTYSLIIKKAGDKFLATQIGELKADLTNLVKSHWPKLAVGIIWASLLYFLYQYKEAHGMDNTETALMIFDFVTMTIWGPLLYIFFYTIRPLTFFPATALTILSGVFFGFTEGTLLTILAANASAAVAYGVGRFFGRGWSFEEGVFGNWISRLRENAFTAVLTMRLIFLPFDGLSYAAGILRVKFIPFLFATFMGTLLGIATFVSIGASLNVDEFRRDGFTFDILEPKFLAFSATIFVLSLALSKIIKQLRQH